MNKKILLVSCALLAVAAPTAVFAGSRWGNEQYCYSHFDSTARQYRGNLAQMHNSGNTFELVMITTTDTATTTTLKVDITDCNGAQRGYVWRNDGNARILAAARSIDDADRFIIDWDTGGQITSIKVDKLSPYRLRGQ